MPGCEVSEDVCLEMPPLCLERCREMSFVSDLFRSVVLALGFAMELEVLDGLAVSVASTGRTTLGGSYAY